MKMYLITYIIQDQKGIDRNFGKCKVSVYRLMCACWSTLKYNIMSLKRPFYILPSDKIIKYICMEILPSHNI